MTAPIGIEVNGAISEIGMITEKVDHKEGIHLVESMVEIILLIIIDVIEIILLIIIDVTETILHIVIGSPYYKKNRNYDNRPTGKNNYRRNPKNTEYGFQGSQRFYNGTRIQKREMGSSFG